MRFSMIAALLGATLLSPVAASAQDGRGQNRAERQQWRAERQQGRTDRPQARPEGPQVRAGRQPVGIVPPQARQERRADRGEARRGWQGTRDGAAATRQYRSDEIRPGQDIRGNGRNVRADNRDWRRDDRRNDRRDWTRDDRPDRGDWNRRGIAGNDWNRDRGGWNGNRSWNNNRGWNGDDRRNWDRGWRAQSRYDWRANRYRNRAAYHLPRYYAPYGWRSGYQRFGIGVTLSSVLWGQNYWIGDPFSYRLPDAWGPYRWVRYYNDALLVDVRSGRVVDVEYDIFW